MIEIKKGTVVKITREIGDITELILDIDHDIKKSINYNSITGNIKAGDRVLVNTTAGTLGLGTGGYHFIIANLELDRLLLDMNGHGMKLKYTPMQLRVPFIEEELSLTGIYNTPLNLKGKIVFMGELHSMLPPLCAYIKHYSITQPKIAYIMTDDGALPLSFSRNIHELINKGLIDTTITSGNSFGGQYECVNLYTSLQTAAHTADCSIIIIIMGPGIVGTNTKYGFSGLEMSMYADLIDRAGGCCLYLPRLGLGDKRERHKGLSHHTLTVLEEMITRPVPIVLPYLNYKQQGFVVNQLNDKNILKRHRLVIRDGSDIEAAMKQYNINTKSMGRGVNEDPAFFYCIGANAGYAIKRNHI